MVYKTSKVELMSKYLSWRGEAEPVLNEVLKCIQLCGKHGRWRGEADSVLNAILQSIQSIEWVLIVPQLLYTSFILLSSLDCPLPVNC